MATLSRRRRIAADSDRPTPELTITIVPKAIQASQTQNQCLLEEIVSLSM
ncbi:hypothetical protein [Natronococcus occultus]|nr:hypothetical protein [Natronococcus occultus]